MTIIDTAPIRGMSLEHATVFTNFQTAYRLAKLGFCVFPCQIAGENTKAPLPGLPWKSASTREGVRLVRLWVRRGFAAPAVDCGKSGLVVIDPDAKNGKRGVEAWDNLLAVHGTVAAPIVSTPSGGRHVYFRQPRREPIIRCSRGDLPPGIDVKGAGGYVVGPGAIIETGRYQLVSGDLLTIPELPSWLTRLLLPERRPQEVASSFVINAACHDTAKICEALAAIPAEAYDDWIAVGMALKAGLGDAGRALWDRWSASSPKYDVSAQARAWSSFRRQGVTIGTIFWLARQYGGGRGV